MQTLLWIPIGVVVLSLLLGAFVGAGSRSGTAGTGALVGGVLGLIATFPLLAIGLSNS